MKTITWSERCVRNQISVSLQPVSIAACCPRPMSAYISIRHRTMEQPSFMAKKKINESIALIFWRKESETSLIDKVLKAQGETAPSPLAPPGWRWRVFLSQAQGQQVEGAAARHGSQRPRRVLRLRTSGAGGLTSRLWRVAFQRESFVSRRDEV